MMEHHNLIRKIEACEKMGSADYICTDKTGILTTNEMYVSKIIIGNNEIKNLENIINNKDEQNIINPLDIFTNEEYWNTLKLAICLNIECQVQTIDNDEIDNNLEKCDSWNKTDKSLIDFLHKFGVSISFFYEVYLSDPDCYKLFQLNPKTKKMISYIKHPDFPSNYRLYVKGAPDKFSQHCTEYMNPN